MTPLRWVVVAVLVLALLGMIRYARGDQHHHGDDVGAYVSRAGLVQVPVG